MYKGDERTRTLNIYVDGVIVTTWTSSGVTLDFETVTLGVTGTSIEFRGVLEDSVWLSIMEVRRYCMRYEMPCTLYALRVPEDKRHCKEGSYVFASVLFCFYEACNAPFYMARPIRYNSSHRCSTHTFKLSRLRQMCWISLERMLQRSIPML